MINNRIVNILAVALLLIGLALLVVYLKPNSATEKKHGETLSHIELLSHYLEKYKNDHGFYPTSKDGIEALIESSYIATGAELDPWQSKYVYKIVNDQFSIYSIGRNKVDENGLGDDISSNN